MTQLDGEGMRQMESMDIHIMKEQQKKHIIKQIAAQTGKSTAQVRSEQPVQVHGFAQTDMFQEEPPSDIEDATMTGEQDTQTEIHQAEHYSQTSRVSQGTPGSQAVRDQGTTGSQAVRDQGVQGSQTNRVRLEDQDAQTDPMEIVASSSSSRSKGVIKEKKAAMRQVVFKHLQEKEGVLTDLVMEIVANRQPDLSAHHFQLEEMIRQSRQQEAEQLARIRLEEGNSKTRTRLERQMHETDLKQLRLR